MDANFPEQFKCPVCYEVPKREIFQCQNGHLVCDICVRKISLCPQCRVSMGSEPIRSRPFEELLDMMKFDCSYKSKGCEILVQRKDITSHFEHCWFGGEQVPLCKYLGLDCSFVVNTKRLLDSWKHLQQNHGCIPTGDKEFHIKAVKMNNINQYRRFLWTPIMVNVFPNLYLVIICSVNANISFTCISVGEEQNDNVQIRFRMVSKKHNMPVLEWTTKPVPQSHSEAILKSPPFQFPYSLLLEKYLKQGDLIFQVNILDQNCNSASHSISAPVVNTFIVSQIYLHDQELLEFKLQLYPWS